MEVLTDHKNLTHLQTAKCLNQQQARWLLFFSRFDFVFTYEPGRLHGKNDALSRMSDTKPRTDSPVMFPSGSFLNAMNDITGLFLEQVWQASAHYSTQGLPRSRAIRQAHGLLFYHQRLFLPTPALQAMALHWCRDSPVAGHPGATKTISLLRSFWWPHLRQQARQYVLTCRICAQNKVP